MQWGPRRLILMEALTVHGTLMSPLVVHRHRQRLRCIASTGHERIFIARKVGLQRNFSEPLRMERLSTAAGYYVLRTEGLSLSEQKRRCATHV